jgi:hypothetical protein
LRLPGPTTRVAAEIPAVITRSTDESRIFVLVEITVGSKNVGVSALIDSGAEGLFINRKLVDEHRIPKEKMARTVTAQNADGTLNRTGVITEKATIPINLGSKVSKETFWITALGNYDMILGHPWLARQNPIIDWKERTVELSAMGRMNKATELAQAHYQKDNRTLKEQVPEYLHPYLDVFDEEKAKAFPPSRSYDHRIKLKPGFVEKKAKVYPMSPPEEKMLNDFIDENLAKGYIVPSESPQASPVFFVAKKDGTGRLCQDYRRLNTYTVKNSYPLPRIGEIMDVTKDWKYFTTIDVKAGYNNIRMATKEDQELAAFVTHRGSFQPTVMFFGLCNSPATFQAFMDDIYGDVKRKKEGSVYMDDIITGGKDLQECIQRTIKIIRIMDANGLHAKISKCKFCIESVPYLGMILSAGKIEMDPVKLEGISGWPIPAKVKDVQKFLGFANFYRKFIAHYADISRPLTDLMRKNIIWEWQNDRQKAFDTLKEAFLSKPILQIPDSSRPFVLETDASKYATGAVLMQEDTNGDLKPCGFISQRFNKAEQNYQIYDRELLAIVRAFKTWKHYLLGNNTLIRCDHKNLLYFKDPQVLTPRQARWQIYLSMFDFQITHIPGPQMVQADALSRRPDHMEDDEENHPETLLPDWLFLSAIGVSSQDQDLMDQLRMTGQQDEILLQAVEALKSGKLPPLRSSVGDWYIHDGILFYKGRIYVPDDLNLRREITRRYHDLESAGHPGQHGTYLAIYRTYWWPRMAVFIRNYVDGCAICQQNKVNTHPTAPPLLPIRPDQEMLPFSNISMDFITQLPDSEGYSALYVIVDYLSKGIILIPCTKEEDALSTAKMYHDHVYK